MMHFKLNTAPFGVCLGALALLTALPGCGSGKGDSAEGTASESSSSSSSTSTTDPTEPTAGETTATTEAPSTTDTSSTTSPETTVTTGEPACDDPEGQANNAVCGDVSGCGCASGKCFIVPAIGGFCGECLGDADCAASGGGCTVPNPIAGVGSTCNMGEAGAGCETNAVCATPEAAFCGTLLEVPTIISVATCGACAVNADCVAADPALPNCAPTYDVMNFSGQYVCVADASIANNGGCNLTKDENNLPVGNAACSSGFCGTASVMGLVKVGICGECSSDADCVDPEKPKCLDPLVDLNSAVLFGSVCSP